MPRSVSDASMGYNVDDMLDSPPTRGMPNVRALADALEPPPDMAALKVPYSQVFFVFVGHRAHIPGSMCIYRLEFASCLLMGLCRTVSSCG